MFLLQENIFIELDSATFSIPPFIDYKRLR